MKPPSKQNGPGASYSIDVMEFIAQSIETNPELAEWLREHEKMVASLSAEQRAEYDRRENEARQACEEAERAFEAKRRDDELAREERHRHLEADRRAGIIGTQTEVGGPYGLSGVAVGRILDAHGLRERVDVRVEDPDGVLHLLRGVVQGYAVWDEATGRDFWIAAKVAASLTAYIRKGQPKS